MEIAIEHGDDPKRAATIEAEAKPVSGGWQPAKCRVVDDPNKLRGPTTHHDIPVGSEVYAEENDALQAALDAGREWYEKRVAERGE
jgi:hypothetical protein